MLLAKLSAGDLISQEAVFHSSRLVSLGNIVNQSPEDGEEKLLQGIALAPLVAKLDEAIQ